MWQACGDDDYGRIVKLLILTGQRRREIGDLTWAEIDRAKRQIELPAERTKNDRPHVVPLSEAIGLLPLARVERDLVFGRGAGGFSGWSKAKSELDARIAADRKESGIENAMPAWRLHDLRRSCVTASTRTASPSRTSSKPSSITCQGHLAGIAGTYNKAIYLAERRQALERWSAHIVALVEGGKQCRADQGAHQLMQATRGMVQLGTILPRVRTSGLDGDMRIAA